MNCNQTKDKTSDVVHTTIKVNRTTKTKGMIKMKTNQNELKRYDDTLTNSIKTMDGLIAAGIAESHAFAFTILQNEKELKLVDQPHDADDLDKLMKALADDLCRYFKGSKSRH